MLSSFLSLGLSSHGSGVFYINLRLTFNQVFLHQLLPSVLDMRGYHPQGLTLSSLFSFWIREKTLTRIDEAENSSLGLPHYPFLRCPFTTWSQGDIHSVPILYEPGRLR